MRLGCGQRAGMVIGGAVRQQQRHRLIGACGQLILGTVLLPAHDIGGRLGHVDMHRVDGADHRQRRRLTRRHQRALRGLRQTDHPVQRRGDGGAIQINIGGLQLCLGGFHGGFGGIASGDGAFFGLHAGDAAVAQLAHAGGFAAGLCGLGLRLRQRGFRLRHGGFIGARVDPVQRIALLDLAAFFKQAFHDDAVDLRAQLCLGRGDDAARKGRGQRHIFGFQGHHGDGRRWRRCATRFLRPCRGTAEQRYAEHAGTHNRLD